jgi:hypothetical protein
VLHSHLPVYQGGYEGQKRVYHVNAADEVTQLEIMVSVSRIGKYCLALLLKGMLNQFPFQVRGFDSDDGTEYVNRVAAQLLDRLLIRFILSIPRHLGIGCQIKIWLQLRLSSCK